MQGIFTSSKNFKPYMIDKNYNVKKEDTVNMGARLDICKLYSINTPIKETHYTAPVYLSDYDYDHRELDKYIYKDKYDFTDFAEKLKKDLKDNKIKENFEVNDEYISIIYNKNPINYYIYHSMLYRNNITFPYAFDDISNITCYFYLVANKNDFNYLTTENDTLLILNGYKTGEKKIKYNENDIVSTIRNNNEIILIIKQNIQLTFKVYTFNMYSSIFTKWLISFTK
jgi:hypothetical protein